MNTTSHHLPGEEGPSVAPSTGRATVEDLGTLLRIAIPSRKLWWVFVGVGIELMFWGYFEFLTAATAAKMLAPASGLGYAVIGGWNFFFPLGWFAVWTLGGVSLIYTLAWMLAGQELIEVSAEAITIRRAVLDLGRPRSYRVPYIARLRLDRIRGKGQLSGYGLRFYPALWRQRDNWLAFDYNARIVRFADDVDEAEARQILETMLNRFPTYLGIAEKEAAS